MIDQNFIRSEHDACVYVKQVSEQEHLYLLLYVDDMLIAGKSKSEINKVKEQLSMEFEMKDMGPASRILGIDIIRDMKNGVLRMSQASYIHNVVQRFNMAEAKVTRSPIGAHFKLAAVRDDDECIDNNAVPYASAVGSIMYMARPGSIHWEAVKWILRYMRGSQDLNLVFTKEKEFRVTGYCDSDYAADLDRRRSVSGYVFTVGGNTVSWKANLQSVTALSTTEAEFMALTEAAKEALWIKGLMKDLGLEQDKVTLWCDS
ncbi:putative RNA-directed DNA polymerase [Arabidopsis thaliana]